MSTIIQPLARDVSDAVRSSQAVSSPAQAALELVYNALDAGATEVVVALDVGALSITVRDNGRGIAAAELALVGERHATSKLRALSRDGRVAVGTFGFRGEALHALGLVGQLEVVSRARGGDGARRHRRPAVTCGGRVGDSVTRVDFMLSGTCYFLSLCPLVRGGVLMGHSSAPGRARSRRCGP